MGPPDKVEALERRYQSLLQAYQANTLDEAAFRAELHKLMFQDSWGHYWLIEAQSGTWHYYDGYHWRPANPAEADQLPFLDEQGRYWQKGVRSGDWYYYQPETEEWVRADQDEEAPIPLAGEQPEQALIPGSKPSIFKQTIKETRRERDGRLHFRIETGLFLLLLSLIFLIRISNISYNTLFVDEAIYAIIGKEALSGIFSQNATTWMYGSYFYPAIAAVTDHFAGATGLRVLSAVFSSMAAVFLYLATSRLYSRQAGLWAMLFFGLCGISINLGQVAVYDAPSVGLLAIAFYCLVMAALGSKEQEGYYLAGAALSFSLSVLAKYLAVLYLPALFLIGLTLYISRGHSISPLFTKFLGLSFYILGAYVWRYWHDLVALFTFSGGIYSFQASTNRDIIKLIWDEAGLVIVLALGALFLLPRVSFNTPGFQHRWAVFLTAGCLPLLIVSLLAAPLYHLMQGNSGSLWKHLVYSLIFLAPLAGHGLATTIWKCRSYQGQRAIYFRAIGAAITLVVVSWFVDHALDQNWRFQHSWPNVTGVINYIESRGLTPESRILAEGGQVYEYYLGLGAEEQATWDNTWYMEYEEQQGTAAMVTAILARELDFVVLDGHYNPGTTQALEPILAQAGYMIEYEELQKLTTGRDIYLRVYAVPEYASKEN